ncbi:MAG: hypothetical protein CVV41_22045 [Candidatus Riflebacteria bacterium HGW-Riflebacteria-1]|jgi:cyanate permease|nr:MAG: hypothetical protein CVV41_22045 [Candidatus Riflebacteria bacterium HGW-Riflebacteria-1]
MKLIKQLFIWIIVLTILNIGGTLALYLYWDKRITDSAMVISIASGVTMGIAIGVVSYLKQKRADAAK